MKKLLLLAGLLVVAGSAFAAEDVKTTVSDDVKIYAQVLTDLTIKTKPLDFGVLGLDDNHKVEYSDQTNAGEFTISGAKNTNISLVIEDVNDSSHKFTNGEITAKLVRENGNKSTGNDILTPQISIFEENGKKIMDDFVFQTGNDGQLHKPAEKVFKVAGEIKTRIGQNTGNYEGAIKVTAKYDSWAGKKAE